MSEATQESSLVNNGVFWTATITALIGCLLKTMSMMYKSKCRTVKFCCITIIRDIESEATIDRTTTTQPTEANI